MKKYDTKRVNFKVFRYNKEIDRMPYYESYLFSVAQDEVVLDILNKIKWKKDGSFSYRRSCRHGICGSCASRKSAPVTSNAHPHGFSLGSCWVRRSLSPKVTRTESEGLNRTRRYLRHQSFQNSLAVLDLLRILCGVDTTIL